jgi:hypothetical protein
MRLSDALEIQSELQAELPLRLITRDGEEPAVGIGIAVSSSSGNYRIALRPRYAEDLEGVESYLGRATRGELDIQVTGPIVALGARLSLGVSTAHHRGRTGTIGFFARRGSDGAIGFVSNNHIIAAEDIGNDGDEIIHPGHPDDRSSGNVVAYLDGSYPRLHTPGATVDCAFAVLAEGLDFETSVSAEETLSSEIVVPRKQLEVGKIGRSTGRTRGYITAFNMNQIKVDYPRAAQESNVHRGQEAGKCRQVLFRSQIEIASIDGQPFSQPGDSGSLVFTSDHHPLGLLFASSAAGGTENSGLTFANPLPAVLESLGLTLLT